MKVEPLVAEHGVVPLTLALDYPRRSFSRDHLFQLLDEGLISIQGSRHRCTQRRRKLRAQHSDPSMRLITRLSE